MLNNSSSLNEHSEKDIECLQTARLLQTPTSQTEAEIFSVAAGELKIKVCLIQIHELRNGSWYSDLLEQS